METPRRQTVFDVAALIAVGLLLAALHFFVPTDIQSQLVFDHERFAPWTLLTAAYVHNSTQHLLGNLVGYGVGATIAHVLCTGQDRRRWFWTTTVAFLLVLPILTNLTSYAAFQALDLEPTSRGFSGDVAGYAGFILVALSRGLADRYSPKVGLAVGQGVVLLLLGEVAVIYTSVPSLTISGLLVLGIGLSVFQLGRWGAEQEWTDEEKQDAALDAGFAVTVVALLVAFVWVLFPASIVQGGSTTNIIAHGAGFGWGIIMSGYLKSDLANLWRSSGRRDVF